MKEHISVYSDGAKNNGLHTKSTLDTAVVKGAAVAQQLLQDIFAVRNSVELP